MGGGGGEGGVGGVLGAGAEPWGVGPVKLQERMEREEVPTLLPAVNPTKRGTRGAPNTSHRSTYCTRRGGVVALAASTYTDSS